MALAMLHVSLSLYGHVSTALHCRQTKQCGAPFRKLVCLESPQQLGANDSQTDGSEGCVCPTALCLLCLY